MEDYWKVKKRGSWELFLPKNDFKTSSAINFPKKHSDFGGVETNQRHETLTKIFFLMVFYRWTQYNVKIGFDAEGKTQKKSIDWKTEFNNFFSFIFLEVLIPES